MKRALLDEATKKFIVWSNAQLVPLTADLQGEEKRLSKDEVTLKSGKNQKTTPVNPVLLMGGRARQIGLIRDLPGINHRLSGILKLRSKIAKFLGKVDKNEQPFGRISILATEAARKKGTMSTFKFDVSILQTRALLMTTSLLLRCDYDVLSDLVNIYRNSTPVDKLGLGWLRCNLTLDLSSNREDCLKLVEEACLKGQPMVVIEARLLFVKFSALKRFAPANAASAEGLLTGARQQIELARDQMKISPSTAFMHGEVDETEKMLRDDTFYTAVTSTEKQDVYLAMAQSFRGTGHWYYCENMHPVSLRVLQDVGFPADIAQFTIGECGMPMQNARCPECSAPVGGQNHTSAAGVTPATDLDRDFGRLML